ncbi:hypothetical protein J6590_065466 [Homalodisca vitripennis]|nr:hypothetical protein J6590_065466 [Homalodisca vitripennis]
MCRTHDSNKIDTNFCFSSSAATFIERVKCLRCWVYNHVIISVNYVFADLCGFVASSRQSDEPDEEADINDDEEEITEEVQCFVSMLICWLLLSFVWPVSLPFPLVGHKINTKIAVHKLKK